MLLKPELLPAGWGLPKDYHRLPLNRAITAVRCYELL